MFHVAVILSGSSSRGRLPGCHLRSRSRCCNSTTSSFDKPRRAHFERNPEIMESFGKENGSSPVFRTSYHGSIEETVGQTQNKFPHIQGSHRPSRQILTGSPYPWLFLFLTIWYEAPSSDSLRKGKMIFARLTIASPRKISERAQRSSRNWMMPDDNSRNLTQRPRYGIRIPQPEKRNTTEAQAASTSAEGTEGWRKVRPRGPVCRRRPRCHRE